MVTTCLLLRPSAVVGNCKLPAAAFLRYNGYSQHYGAVWSAIEGVMMGTSRYERVFAAIDGRETQEAVARRALQIASLNHANLLFGRVVEAIPTELNAIDFGDLCAAFREKTEEDLEDILSEAKADPNIGEVEVRVVAGPVNDALDSRLIRPYEPDLVICGERGLSNFQYAFMGSTSKYLVRSQDCDVLVVKSHG